MAIRILLDHGVPEDHIIFVTFLVAKGGGISVLRAAFPRIKIVCGAVDDRMKEGWLDVLDEGEGEAGRKVWLMQPGMGQIGTCSLIASSSRSRMNLAFIQGIVTIYSKFHRRVYGHVSVLVGFSRSFRRISALLAGLSGRR